MQPQLPLESLGLILYATLTLNLLGTSRLNPRLSAEAGLNSAFDFNRTPLATPGICIVVHEAPGNRCTWAPQVVDRWYLGPAPDHYLCHRFYIPHNRAKRITKTVDFYPHDCPPPSGSSTNAATTAARVLAKSLLHPTPTPFATLGNNQFAALQKISRIFSNVTASPPTYPALKVP